MENNEDGIDSKILTSFEYFDECTSILRAIQAVDIMVDPSPDDQRVEDSQIKRLDYMLTEYQEQSYLLDPHLELFIVPLVNVLRRHCQVFVATPTKVRGYKTIVRFFPHEVSDLSVIIEYLSTSGPALEPDQWVLRYIILLWLSLVCMLPFDLAQFDIAEEGETAVAINNIAKKHINKAGVERDGAALLLSKLYSRKDATAFLEGLLREINLQSKDRADIFMCIGVLRVITIMTKSAPFELLQKHILHVQEFIDATSLSQHLQGSSIVRKLRIKAVSRIATRLLPVRQVTRKLNALVRDVIVPGAPIETNDDLEFDVPVSVENSFETLFDSLQDKDTAVRWSAAKGISRISERLPSSFVDQILDNVLGFFTIHSQTGNLEEMPASADQTWHGATLACAELARRDLIATDRLSEVLGWILKALFFDIRKSTFSVGSNVRDAAAYVLWSLARTQQKDIMRPFAQDLAQKLIIATLFDREIHIRRAASAAFQEYVGRLDLFPHGIAVLGYTDFYSISIRRNAFLVSAIQVAAFNEYLSPLVDHLLNVTLRHWSEVMRRLASQSIRAICELDPIELIPEVINGAKHMLCSADVTVVHGGLLVLSELASVPYSAKETEMEGYRIQILGLLNSVEPTILFSPRNHLPLEAACYLVSNSISIQITDQPQAANQNVVWRQIIEKGLRHRDSDVQKAAASAMASMSHLSDCSLDVKRFVAEFNGSTHHFQRSISRMLGFIDYTRFANGFDLALTCLLQSVDPTSPNYIKDVEVRQNAYASLTAMTVNVSSRLSDCLMPKRMCAIFAAFLSGLDDYTISERGDVGSWVRIACVKGLGSSLQALIHNASVIERSAAETLPHSQLGFSAYLPVHTFHDIIGGILKQGVERLDNVRRCAGEVFVSLLCLESPNINEGEKWTISRGRSFREILDSTAVGNWSEGSWLYPKAVHFLDVDIYRQQVLRGLILSIASKIGSTQRPASAAIISYARELPPFMNGNLLQSSAIKYSLEELITDLLALVQQNAITNSVIVPVLQTFNLLLDSDLFIPIAAAGSSRGFATLQALLEFVSKNVDRLKNVQRVEESMKVVVNILPLPSAALYKAAVLAICQFLRHRFPTIRSDTAEALYLVLQTRDIVDDEELESVLLETEWSMDDLSSVTESVDCIRKILQSRELN